MKETGGRLIITLICTLSISKVEVMCRSTRLRVSILQHTLGNPSKPRSILKQPVLCSNSPLDKLYVVVKCSSQRINVGRLLIRKISLTAVIFRTSHDVDRQLNYKNITLDLILIIPSKSSPTVMGYFWSPWRTSYSSKKSFFYLDTPLSHAHFQFKYLTLWKGDISGVRMPQNCKALRTDTTQNNTE